MYTYAGGASQYARASQNCCSECAQTSTELGFLPMAAAGAAGASSGAGGLLAAAGGPVGIALAGIQLAVQFFMARAAQRHADEEVRGSLQTDAYNAFREIEKQMDVAQCAGGDPAQYIAAATQGVRDIVSAFNSACQSVKTKSVKTSCANIVREQAAWEPEVANYAQKQCAARAAERLTIAPIAGAPSAVSATGQTGTNNDVTSQNSPVSASGNIQIAGVSISPTMILIGGGAALALAFFAPRGK